MSSKILAGRYELFEKIGEGGMSVVYKARCRLLNRYVAIKILKPEFIKDSKFTDSFRREAQAAARLQHPNIVNVYDVGKEGNIHYIVMELIEGRVLSDIISEEGKIPYKRAIEITKQIASALGFAHKNHIIHRDVKPHNILITNSGIAKITDFGIAKAMSDATIVDNSQEGIMGSVHYFSPEQARGGYVDEKSDIYSLGIVLYEMLTSRVPFDSDNPVSVALMHINEQMTPPSKLVKDIPPGLEQIVLKATDKYQVNRYASAEDMIEALDNIEFVTKVIGTGADLFPKADKPAEGYSKGLIEDEDDKYVDYNDPHKEKTVKKNKGKSKKKLIMIIIAIIAAIAIFAGIGFASGLFNKTPKVPDLVGMTYSDAKEKASLEGYKLKKGDFIYDDKAEKGEIVSQDPEEGTEAEKGTYITVNISKGKGYETVPKVIGLNTSEAEKKLEENGFKLGRVNQEASEEPEGEIIGQNPYAGDTAEAGTAVNVTISDGSKKYTNVPSLLGKTVEEADTALRNADLRLGDVGYDYSDKYEEGQVIWQEYSKGESLLSGDAVAVTISKGKKQTDGSIDLYIDYKSAENDVFYLTVTVSDEKGTRNVISSQQVAKSDEGQALKINGRGKGTVIVLFDSDEVMRKSVDFDAGTVS